MGSQGKSKLLPKHSNKKWFFRSQSLCNKHVTKLPITCFRKMTNMLKEHKNFTDSSLVGLWRKKKMYKKLKNKWSLMTKVKNMARMSLNFIVVKTHGMILDYSERTMSCGWFWVVKTCAKDLVCSVLRTIVSVHLVQKLKRFDYAGAYFRGNSIKLWLFRAEISK